MGLLAGRAGGDENCSNADEKTRNVCAKGTFYSIFEENQP